MTTFILILLLIASLFLTWALLAFFLALGLRLMKVLGITIARVAIATISIFVIQLLLTLSFLLIAQAPRQIALGGCVLALIAAVLLPALVIAIVFKVTTIRAVPVWLGTLILSLTTNFFFSAAMKGMVIEAYVMPTNGMAPTLLGNHWQAVCPQCSRPNYCSPREPQHQSPDLPNWICPNFHVNQLPPIDLRQFGGDRIVCSKFLKPKRWDILAFRFPVDPRSVYAQRVVGLPGESVHIEDSAVWIDGKKLEPPDPLRGIQFLDKIPGHDIEIAGSKDNPAVLGPDEYFVLGDFSAQSSDSRFWHGGAEGHPDYAVPASHIKGVITHIYWPPSRWRVFR